MIGIGNCRWKLKISQYHLHFQMGYNRNLWTDPISPDSSRVKAFNKRSDLTLSYLISKCQISETTTCFGTQTDK